jgi:hypothetical protein
VRRTKVASHFGAETPKPANRFRSPRAPTPTSLSDLLAGVKRVPRPATEARGSFGNGDHAPRAGTARILPGPEEIEALHRGSFESGRNSAGRRAEAGEARAGVALSVSVRGTVPPRRKVSLSVEDSDVDATACPPARR